MYASEMSVLNESVMQSGISAKTQPEEDQETKRKYLLLAICMLILVLIILMLLGFLNPVDIDKSTSVRDPELNVYVQPPVRSHKSSTNPATIRTTTTTTRMLTATNILAPSTRTLTTTRTPTTTTITTTTITTTTIRTTTEDNFQLQADYAEPIYKDAHNYACLFNASKQGLQAFGRTYGIAYFPFQVCHIILYCCYTLKSNMEFEPANPAVDLAPRDAVRRAADFKKNNTWLWIYLIVEGSNDNFEKLMDNRSGEVNTFTDYAVHWLNRSNYDGIRILWRDTPANRNATIVSFSNAVALALYPHKRSVGFFVPYEVPLRAPYDVHALQYALRVRYTIMLYHARPLRRPSNVKWLEYADVRFTAHQQDVTVRNMFCHMFPLQWHRFVLNDSSCDGRSIRRGTTSVVDWGPQGPITQSPGLLSRYEVCDMVNSTWTRRRVGSAIYACKGTDVLVGLDAAAGRNWIKNDLHDPSNGICFGYMDPENDDFPGRCNAGHFFPLVRNMFRFFVHGRAQSGGRRHADLLLLTSNE